MFFKLDSKKAIEAAATLLRLASHKTLGRKRLLALLYLADRAAFKKTGRPILGGKLYALKWGPIHSEIYDFIKGDHPRDQALWSSFFENDSYNVILANDPGVSALSRFEISVLNEISQQFIGYDDFDVAEVTHFPEYQKAYRDGTSTPIDVNDYIEFAAEGRDKDKILRDAEEKNYFDNLFKTTP